MRLEPVGLGYENEARAKRSSRGAFGIGLGRIYSAKSFWLAADAGWILGGCVIRGQSGNGRLSALGKALKSRVIGFRIYCRVADGG